jgi:hypothetical protein
VLTATMAAAGVTRAARKKRSEGKEPNEARVRATGYLGGFVPPRSTRDRRIDVNEGSAGPGPRCGLGAARAVREAGSWAGFARWAEWLAFGPKWPCFILFFQKHI